MASLIGNIYKYYVYIQSHLFVACLLNDFEKKRKSGGKDLVGGRGVEYFLEGSGQGARF